MRKQAATALALGALMASVCSVAPQELPGPVRAASSTAMMPAPEIPVTPPTAPAPAPAVTEAAPEPGPAAGEPEPLPATVPVFEPRIVVDNTVSPESAAGVDGVLAAVPAARLSATSRTPAGTDRTLSVLVVDPATFRSFTPEATANATAVWERLREGDLIITHAAGTEVGAILGDTITVSGPGGSHAIRVGAFASTGAPPLADVVVAWDRGRDLGATTADTAVVAVAPDQDEDALGDRLASALAGVASVRERPEQQQANASLGTIQLEPFTYTDNGDGMITIDPAWVKRNISTIEIPGWGAMRCNNIILPQLQAAFAEITAQGLLPLMNDYGGCYVPRHILFNPDRALSRHAWGLAFDTNVATNGYGAIPTIDMRIVDIFRRWGFKWGGDFSTPDGMHFELERVVTPG